MVIYIKELDKNDNIKLLDKIPIFLHKLVLKIFEVSGYFFLQNIDEEQQIIVIPNVNKKKVYKNIKNTIKKKSKTTKRKIEVVLSEKLHEFVNEFDGIKIVNGRKIYIDNIDLVIKKVIGESPIEIQDIYILSNSYNSTNINIINKLVNSVKSINIITKDIRNYNVLENVLSEKGVAITVSNNKKKSLKKSKLIINLDFSDNDLNKYSIFRNACIINLNEIVIKKLKCFDGIIINNIEIELPEDILKKMKEYNLIEKFRKIELIESLKNENLKIVIGALLGNNGTINEKERLNVQKILTK